MKTYRPIIQDDELFGREVNPFGDYALFAYKQNPKSTGDIISANHDAWIEAEQNLKTFKVDNYWYQIFDGEFFSRTYKDEKGHFVATLFTDGINFTADLNDNNQLINLNII